MKRRAEAKASAAAEIEARAAAVAPAPAMQRNEETGRRSRVQPVADFIERL